MAEQDTVALIQHAEEIADKCAPFLAGHAPDLQGAALIDLVARWLAGHHPDLRDAIWKVWTETVLGIIPVMEQRVLENHGFENWDEATARLHGSSATDS